MQKPLRCCYAIPVNAEGFRYEDNAALLQREWNDLLEIRNSEGIWNLTWSWAGYEKEFAISENWWKAGIAIQNLLLLRAFGCLVED